MYDDLTRSILEQRDNIENQRNREIRANEESYIKRLEKENKELKQQNKFLMKQDNILQSLMQWIYSELNYAKNWYNPDSEEYIGPKRYPDDTLDGFKIVIDKIKELKEELK